MTLRITGKRIGLMVVVCFSLLVILQVKGGYIGCYLRESKNTPRKRLMCSPMTAVAKSNIGSSPGWMAGICDAPAPAMPAPWRSRKSDGRSR